MGKASKNSISIKQIEIACKHVGELRRFGMAFNMACRSLEFFTECYAQQISWGVSGPMSAKRVPLENWSREARLLRKKHPKRIFLKSGELVRVEHGTPIREFARLFLNLYNEGELTEINSKRLVKRYWKVAVITRGEDAKLNKINRSKMLSSPDKRWRLGGIKF